MSGKPKIYKFRGMKKLVQHVRNDLDSGEQDFILLFAYNGTGKTRLSMAFKEAGKRRRKGEAVSKLEKRDTLYFNAFTEDLFVWDNDLENDVNRVLKINSLSRFFSGFEQLDLDNRIRPFLRRYAKFDFSIRYEKDDDGIDDWKVVFWCDEMGNRIENIKVSRGEQNIFVWCMFLAIVQLAIEGAEAYNWVKYVYIDDPISSLDDNNAIAVASDLIQLMKDGVGRIKTVISSHHSLFFNVICNEVKSVSGIKSKRFFLYKSDTSNEQFLQATDDTPFFHHVALLTELYETANSPRGKLNTYHFNALRSVLERTATFFGLQHFSSCIHGIEDEILYERALQLLSHGKYSLFEPVEMGSDNKKLFRDILNAFMQKYQFNLPELISTTPSPAPTFSASVSAEAATPAEQPS